MPIAASIAAAGATLGSAALTSNAAHTAANAQANASAQNLAFENKVYDTAQGNLSPTIAQGNQAGGALAGLLNIGGNPQQAQQAFGNYIGSTNYNFLLDQGLQSQKYLNAPNLVSGATGKALTNYAQGQAGNALGGYEQLLAGQQGLGAQSALGLAGVGTNIAGQEAQANNLTAGAQGSAALTGASAWGNALSGLSQLAGQYSGQSSYGAGSGFGSFGAGGSSNPFATGINDIFNGGGAKASAFAG